MTDLIITARARLNVEAFVAAMLEREPMPLVGRIVEGLVASEEHGLKATIANTTWYHDGAGAFVRTLANRLLGSPDAMREREPAPALAGDDRIASPIPRDVRGRWRKDAARGDRAAAEPMTARMRILALLDHVDRLDSLVERLIERLGEPGAPPMPDPSVERVSLERLVAVDRTMRAIAAGSGHLTTDDLAVIAELFATEIARRRDRVDAVVTREAR